MRCRCQQLEQPTALELDALSRNQDVIHKYEDDELVHDRITSAFFVNVHFAGQYAIEHAAELQGITSNAIDMIEPPQQLTFQLNFGNTYLPDPILLMKRISQHLIQTTLY